MKLGPTVDAAFQKSARAQYFEFTVVIEVAQPDIPLPRSRETHLFTVVGIGSDAAPHRGDRSFAKKNEVTLLERVFSRDVTDEYVRDAITVNVAEIYPHAFERIMAEDLRFRRPKPRLPSITAKLGAPGEERLRSSRSG